MKILRNFFLIMLILIASGCSLTLVGMVMFP